MKARWLAVITLVLVLTVLLTVQLTGCSPPEPPPVQPPAKPIMAPSSSDITLEPGMRQTLSASAEGAVDYEWALDGDGTLSSTTGDTVLYTASDQAGAMALIRVTARNAGGASPSSSITINTVAAPAVELGSLGIPAGWMTEEGKNPAEFLALTNPSGCRTGAECIQIAYRSGNVWAGIMWWPVACGASGTPDAWRRVSQGLCPVDVAHMGGLRSVTKLTFWARGEQGGEVVEFKVGDPQTLPTPGRVKSVTLTPDWERYEIDLTGLDMTRAIALFIVVFTDLHNPEGATVQLDDVRFEGTR